MTQEKTAEEKSVGRPYAQFILYQCETGYLLEVYLSNIKFQRGQKWAFTDIKDLKKGLSILFEGNKSNDQ